MLTAQFPGHREITGRVVMAAVQLADGYASQLTPAEAAAIGLVTDILAFAAEQVTREAGAA